MFNWPREGRWKNECWGEGVFACVLGKLKRRYRRAYHRPPRVVKEFMPRRARFYHKMASPRTSGPTHAVERSSNRNTIRSGECVARRVGRGEPAPSARYRCLQGTGRDRPAGAWKAVAEVKGHG